jgi:hypothetical protein
MYDMPHVFNQVSLCPQAPRYAVMHALATHQAGHFTVHQRIKLSQTLFHHFLLQPQHTHLLDVCNNTNDIIVTLPSSHAAQLLFLPAAHRTACFAASFVSHPHTLCAPTT